MPAIYSPRNPENSPLYRIIEDHYEEFRNTYNERYGSTYGFFRPEISREIEKFQKCGIYRFGFAKIKCTNADCGEEKILPFSCHGHGLCPSCIQKYALELEGLLTEEVLREVPMRHLVFTIPVRLRKNFFWYRKSLTELSRLAWKTTKTFMKETLKVEGVPGAIHSIETSGQYLKLNPHLHILVTDGIFTDDGKFYKMPNYDYGAVIYLKSLWEKAVANFCIKKGFIKKDLMSKMLFWRHTGFSVYTDTKIDYKRDDQKSSDAIRHIIRYIAKPPIALKNLTYKGGKVLYKGHFQKSKNQNFEVYDPIDFLAALTSHIPKNRQKYVLYYGVFSSRTRGHNKKTAAKIDDNYPVVCPEVTGEQKAYRKSWAVLIKKVWEVDPLKCEKCGSEMKVTAIVIDNTSIKKILKSVGLWKELSYGRAPPKFVKPFVDEVEYVPFDDDWESPVY